MIERASKKTKRSSKKNKIAKPQSNNTDFEALTTLIGKASDASALGQELIATADQITESAGVLAKHTVHSIEDVCVSLARTLPHPARRRRRA